MRLTVEEYEACERAASRGDLRARLHAAAPISFPSLYESHYAGQHKLVFRGTTDYYRKYAWS